MIAVVDIDSQQDRSASGDAVRRVAELAELSGFRTFRVPRDFDSVGGPEAALWNVPRFERPEPAIWVGYMMPPGAYATTYRALRGHNVVLINDPEEHRLAEEFDQSYPKLLGLTARSSVVSNSADAVSASKEIGLPVFLKGAVQSLKAEGISSCRAETIEDVERISARLLAHESRTRGKVIVREYMTFRHQELSPMGMPAGREFRAFVLNGEIVELAYYWPSEDPLATLGPIERTTVVALAQRAYRALKVPWLAVDIGQLNDSSWTIVEVGDAQFAGLCRASPFRILEALRPFAVSVETSRRSQPS